MSAAVRMFYESAFPSPLNGERARVRGGFAESPAGFHSSGPSHPSPSIPLPVEGRGKNDVNAHQINRVLEFASQP
jgi:hypothetical protein